MTSSASRLSKSRFTSGLQCHKKLWWEVHEPDAVELQPDKVLQDRFDQGRLVGQAARTRYPGGVLIDLPYNAYAERIAATKAGLASEGALYGTLTGAFTYLSKNSSAVRYARMLFSFLMNPCPSSGNTTYSATPPRRRTASTI